jgi:hypothetical protein
MMVTVDAMVRHILQALNSLQDFLNAGPHLLPTFVDYFSLQGGFAALHSHRGMAGKSETLVHVAGLVLRERPVLGVVKTRCLIDDKHSRRHVGFRLVTSRRASRSSRIRCFDGFTCLARPGREPSSFSMPSSMASSSSSLSPSPLSTAASPS